MARIRTIKPEFCSSADVGALSRDARLFFLQLLTECDDHGRLLWIPRRLCGVLYPFDADVTAEMITAWMHECVERGMLIHYQAGSNQILQVANWSKHQRVDKPAASRLSALTDEGVTNLSRMAPETVATCSRESREGLAPDLGPRKGNREVEVEGDHSSLRSDSASPMAAAGEAGQQAEPRLQLVPPGEPSDPKPAKPQSNGDPIVESVLGAYHRLLPRCERIAVRSPKRCKRILAMNKLARQLCVQQGWDYRPDWFWAAYFGECKKDPWLRGETPNPNNPRWKQNLDVLLAEDRFAKIMDGAIAAMQVAA